MIFSLDFLAIFEICNFSLDFFSLFSYPSDQTSIFWDHSSWSRGLSPVGWLADTCHNWIYPLHSPPMLLIPIHFLIAFLFSLFFSLFFAQVALIPIHFSYFFYFSCGPSRWIFSSTLIQIMLIILKKIVQILRLILPMTTLTAPCYWSSPVLCLLYGNCWPSTFWQLSQIISRKFSTLPTPLLLSIQHSAFGNNLINIPTTRKCCTFYFWKK